MRQIELMEQIEHMDKITFAEPVIHVENIRKQFGDRVILHDINISIYTSEIFGLLGPSGAGKTTLINILTGQIKQTEGSARLLGLDTRMIDPVTYSRLGLVLDNVGLYERLSCQDNLRLFTKIYKSPEQNIDQVLRKVGLLEAKRTPVMKLSKGMKQRLVLARAILNDPKILFLDEPTSGLDPATALEIHKIIKEQQEKGTAVFLTTHNMEEAEKLCDHVALLHEGKIVEYGNPKDVCRKYNNQNNITILLRSGELVTIRNDRSSAGLLADFMNREEITTIHSTEPNLESVFLELTGRGLNE